MVNAVHSWRELAPLQTRATLGGVSYTVETLYCWNSPSHPIIDQKTNHDEESHGPGIQGMLVLN